MRFLEWDTETFSKVDLKKHGVSRYMRDPSTEVILAAWSFDGGRTMRLWDRFDANSLRSDDIGELFDALKDDRVVKVAWNASFEQNVTEQLFGIKVHFDEWIDPMIMAKHCSLPGALAEVCKIIGLPQDLWKHATGKALIRYFCQMRKPTKTNSALRNYPDDSDKSWEKWQTFREYCKQDVRVEAACLDWLDPWDMPRSEWELWYLDRQINETGIPINRDTLRNAITLVDEIVADRMQMLNRITKLQNANSTEQLLGWLRDRDYPFHDMKIGHVKRALQEAKDDGDGDTKYAKALALRADIAKASVKKYRAFEAYATDDDLLRNMFQFNGAGRTARWCLAEGSPVFVKDQSGRMFEKPIETVTCSDKVWDGREWVAHDGVVYSGEKDVVEHDGVVATEEHKVFVSDREECSLGNAISDGVLIWRGDMRWVVYKITNRVSGRFYVGFTGQPVGERMRQHFVAAERGKRKSKFHDAIRSYGREVWQVEVVEQFKTEEDAREAEVRIIEATRAVEDGYNLSKGALFEPQNGHEHLTWLRQDPSWDSEYRESLSRGCKASAAHQKHSRRFGEISIEWRKANPKQAYKVSYRALRCAQRGAGIARGHALTLYPPQGRVRPAIKNEEGALTRYGRLWMAVHQPGITAKVWAQRTDDQMRAVGAAMSKAQKCRFEQMSEERKTDCDRQLAEARQRIDQNVRKAKQREAIQAYWTPERRAAKSESMKGVGVKKRADK